MRSAVENRVNMNIDPSDLWVWCERIKDTFQKAQDDRERTVRVVSMITRNGEALSMCW